MSLSFLPAEVNAALSHLNLNFVTEIRIRQGQPVIVGYKGCYYFLGELGICSDKNCAVRCGEISQIINGATRGNFFRYAEQMRSGFITCGHGVRIGLAGEYVTQNGEIKTISSLTSLNIRLPHDIGGCSEYICKRLLNEAPKSILLFSKPGMGKTTKLRDIARHVSDNLCLNTLIFDERNEIAAMDENGQGFYLGCRTDVIRAGNKLNAFASAIRAMKPDLIITDELYGESDMQAVRYAADCGICVIASSHITKHEILKGTPFEYFVELETLLGQPVIYDKNFIAYSGDRTDDLDRNIPVDQEEAEDGDFCRAL